MGVGTKVSKVKRRRDLMVRFYLPGAYTKLWIVLLIVRAGATGDTLELGCGYAKHAWYVELHYCRSWHFLTPHLAYLIQSVRKGSQPSMVKLVVACLV